MATVPQTWLIRRWAGARGCRLGLSLFGLLTLTVGCMALDGEKQTEAPKPPAPGDAHQIVATWQNHVMTTADPAHGGAPVVGIAGRLYLFGKEIGFPVVGDGSLRVDLMDETTGTAVPQEVWLIDKDTLNRLLRRDAVGWGYTLFLPWKNYRPDLTRIRLRCRYEPKKGPPLFCEAQVTLAAENGTMVPGQTPLTALPAKPGQAPGAVPGAPPGQVPGAAPGATPGQVPGAAPGAAPGAVPGAAPGQAPGAVPGVAPGAAPGAVPGVAPGVAPGQAPGVVPGAVPGQAPGVTPGRIPVPQRQPQTQPPTQAQLEMLRQAVRPNN